MKRLSKRQERVDATALANQVRDNLDDIAQSRDEAEAAAAAANAAATQLTGSADQNLAYDSHNRLAAARGIAAEYASGRLSANSGAVLPVGDAANPYAHPILRNAAGVVQGHIITLADEGLAPGQTVTVVLTARVNSTNIRWSVHARNAAFAAVAGSPGTQPPFAGTGEQTVSRTFTIPASTAKLEIRFDNVPAGETADIVRYGVFLGSLARAVTEDRARRSDVTLMDARVTINTTDITDLKTKTVESQQVLSAPNQTDVLPAIPAAPATVPSASVQAAWGGVVAPGGSITTNLLTIRPYGTLTVSKARLEIRDSTNAVLAYSDIPASTYNAASAAGTTVQVLLNTAVTTSASMTVMLYAPGQNLPGYYLTPISSTVTMRAFRSAGQDPTGVPTTNNSSGGLWVRFHYDASALMRVYAASVPGQSTDPATLRQAAWDALLGPADVLLPSEVFVLKANGEQFNLYDDHVIRGNWAHAAQVEWNATNNYGQQLAEGVRLEPNSTTTGGNIPLGTFTLSCALYDWSRVAAGTWSTTVTVLDKSKTAPITVQTDGDSRTHRAHYQARILDSLPGVTAVGVRRLTRASTATIRPSTVLAYNGWGGKTLEWFMNRGASGTEVNSPFVFPVGVSATNYRGNVVDRKLMVQCAKGTQPAGFEPFYSYGGHGDLVKEGGASYQYDETTGYPLNPVDGWVVYDPAKAAGQQFQMYGSGAWAAMGTQPSGWEFSPTKHYQRFAWAYPAGVPDVVVSMWSANDFVSGVTPDDAALSAWLDRYVACVNAYRAARADIKVIIPLTGLMALQDGEGALYGTGASHVDMNRTFKVVSRGLLTRFDTAAWKALGVRVSVFGGGVDPVYGYAPGATGVPTVTMAAAGTVVPVAFNDGRVQVNKYAPNLVRRDADGIHEYEYGLYQAADWTAGVIQYVRP